MYTNVPPSLRVHLTKAVLFDLRSAQVMRDGFRMWLGGESGSGKSNCAMLILSQIVEGAGQVIVLDVAGEYERLWELDPANVVRIGYGNEPVNETSVQWCLDIVRSGKSLLVDLSHWAILPQKLDRFALEFVRELYDERRKRPKLTYVVVEEAANLIPQAQQQGQAENIAIFLKVVTEGRKYGLNFILAAQQQSLVDVRAIKGCNVRVFMRISDFRDWKQIRPYVPSRLGISFGAEATSKRDISKFKSGEAIIVSRWTGDLRVRLSMPPISPREPLMEAETGADASYNQQLDREVGWGT